MQRVSFLAALFTLLAVASPPSSAKPRDLSHPCPKYRTNSNLLYPLVAASYVGGTAMHMDMKKGYWYAAPLRISGRQYRVRGQVTLNKNGFMFIFKGNRQPLFALSGLTSVRPCDIASEPAETGAKSNTNPKSKSQSWMIDIPYSQMATLSRATIAPGTLAADSTVYVTGAASLLSVLIGSIASTSSKAKFGGIAAGGLAFGYYLFIARPRSHDNYIAIFLRTPGVKASPNAFFQKGDLIMLKIPNRHDYFNISMILTAKTGKEFASEIAEKGGK